MVFPSRVLAPAAALLAVLVACGDDASSRGSGGGPSGASVSSTGGSTSGPDGASTTSSAGAGDASTGPGGDATSASASGGGTSTTSGDGGASSAGGTSGEGGAASGGGLGGQGGAGDGAGGAEPEAPTRLVLTGDATGASDDGDQLVTCTLGGELADISLAGDDLQGLFSGELLRRVEEGDQAFTFEPFVGGPASVARSDDGSAELRLVGDQPDDAKPYWLAIEVLDAVEVAPFTFEGVWTCAPLDLADTSPPDLETSAVGTFRLGPPEG